MLRDHKRSPLRRALYGATAAGLTLALSLSAAACGTGPAQTTTTVLTYGLDSDVPNLQTIKNQGSASMILNAVLHRGLVAYDAAGQVVPALAETVTDAGKQEYTFVLHEGLTFHDGSALTSQDVKDTLMAMANADNVAKMYPAARNITSVETPDDRTAIVKLSAPDAAFLSYMADVSGAILPSESLGQGEEEPTYVGAGPFKFVSYESGSAFIVEKFDGYYVEDQPSVDRIEFKILADQSARDSALLSGSVDAISFVGWNNYDLVSSNESLVLDETEGPFMYLLFNTTKDSPFANPKVRQAVAWAVDRQAVVDAALAGRGAPLSGMPIPEGSEFYDAAQANFYTQDLDKARALLAEAGYPDGFKARMLSSSQYSFHQNTAISVQDDLKKIGIELEMNLPDWPTRLEVGAAGDYDIAVYGTVGITNDPSFLDQMLTPAGAQNAPYGYDDSTVNDLLAKGRAESDPAARKGVYQQLGEYVLENAPIVGLAWRSQAYGYNKKVTGFSNIPGFLTFDSGYTLASTSVDG